MSFEQNQSQPLSTQLQLPVQEDPLKSPTPLSASSNPVPADASGGLGGIPGNISYTGAAPRVIDSDLTITNVPTLNGARVLIGNFDAARDQLGIDGAASGSESGVTWSYDAARGVLTLDSASAISSDVYQGLLRRATYANTDASNPGAARTIQFSLGNLLASPENGHFYEFVSGGSNVGISWTDAETAASNRNYLGRQGYLVTITSQTEQNFVESRVNGNGWIGASDTPDLPTKGDWRWVTGPEGTEDSGKGRLFWRGTGADANNNTNGAGPVGGFYNNWDLQNGEPNNLTNTDQPNGEDYAHIVGNTGAGNVGKWNDLPNQRNYTPDVIAYQPQGYIVEYGGLSGDTSPVISASLTLSFAGTGTGTGTGTPAAGTTTNVPTFNNVADSNGFIRPNLLWRNYSKISPQSGQNAIWTLNYDPTNTTNAFTINTDPRLTKYIQPVQDLGWRIRGLYDVDGNGIADIFWNNNQTGENAVWFMTFNQNTGFELDLSRTQYLDPVADTSWQMEGVTNFDNAGGPSILWHNRKTGETAIWGYKFDGSVSGQGALTRDPNRTQYVGPNVSSDWTVQGWADFNNDKVPDILWRNEKTGEDVIWKLNTNATSSNPYFNVADSYYINPVADTSWQVAGITDFNKDGVADILWRNYRTGENAIWGMQSGGDYNPALTNYITSVPDTNWKLEGSADYTGDGIPDLVWRNYTTGEDAIWRMKIENSKLVLDQGFYINSAPNLPDLPWVIEGPRPGGSLA